MNFLPILIVGGAIAFLSGRRRRRASRTKGNGKVLPASNTRGAVFEGVGENRPDSIKAKVGDRFSVLFFDNSGSTGYKWSLSASPPDNSVKHVKTEYDELPGGAPGAASGKDIYIFEGAKPGKGSLVFHLQAGWLEGKEPPAEIVEILTEIS